MYIVYVGVPISICTSYKTLINFYVIWTYFKMCDNYLITETIIDVVKYGKIQILKICI